MSNKRIRKKRKKKVLKRLNRIKASAWFATQAMMLLSNAMRGLSSPRFSEGTEYVQKPVPDLKEGERVIHANENRLICKKCGSFDMFHSGGAVGTKPNDIEHQRRVTCNECKHTTSIVNHINLSPTQVDLAIGSFSFDDIKWPKYVEVDSCLDVKWGKVDDE